MCKRDLNLNSYMINIRLSSMTKKFFIKNHPNVLVQGDRGHLEIGDRSFANTKVIVERKITYENSFEKYTIKKIITRLKTIEKIVTNLYNKAMIIFHSLARHLDGLPSPHGDKVRVLLKF